jgi:hypothetical protein
MVTFETVRRLALALPETAEATSYGTPAFKVRGKFLARLREEGVLVVKVGNDAQEALIQMQPETYFITPHYAGSYAVLVRLEAITEDELRDLLVEVWRLNAPKRLAASYAAPGSLQAEAP